MPSRTLSHKLRHIVTLGALVTAMGSSLVLAANNDSPLDRDRGQLRPLIVIAPTSADPAWVSLKKALDEPDNHAAFTQRNMVLYTVINTIGQRDGKSLDPQTTMALIRQLKLGVTNGTKVLLVGKDGETKLDHNGAIDPKEIFATIDKMPMRENESAAAPAAASDADEPAPDKASSAKPATGKAAKGSKAPAAMDD